MEIQNLVPVNWCNQRVLTTAQVSSAYGCPPARIKDNFRLAKEQFEEGVHFFKITGAALRELKQSEGFAPLAISKMASSIYLWTKQGVIRHCKMLNTPQAWEVFDQLEKTYFAVKAAEVPAAEEKPIVEEKPAAEEQHAIEELPAAEEKISDFERGKELVKLLATMEPSPDKTLLSRHVANILLGKKLF